MNVTILEAEIDRAYAHTGVRLSACNNILDKKNLLTQLYNYVEKNERTQNGLNSLAVFKELYNTYVEIERNLSSQNSLINSTLNMSTMAGNNSALNGSALLSANNHNNGSALASNNFNNNMGNLNDNYSDRAGTGSAVQAQQQEAPKQQVNVNLPKTTIPAKGYEIKPFIFKELKLVPLNLGLTEAYELKASEGCSMMQLSKRLNIVDSGTEACVFDTANSWFNNLMMQNEANESDGVISDTFNEYEIVLGRNRSKTFLVDMLKQANCELPRLIESINSTLDPLRTQLGKWLTELVTPYVYIAFNKNNTKIAIENIVSDYDQLTAYCDKVVKDGTVNLAIDFSNAVKQAEAHLKQIYVTSTEVLAKIASGTDESLDMFNDTLVVNQLKTQKIYEPSRYLYLAPIVLEDVNKINTFHSMLGHLVVPIPLKIDETGSFKIYEFITTLPKEIPVVYISDSFNKFKVVRFNNEFYLFKI